MSGYIPLFASLTTGTLCGRWPDVGLWPIVLSLTDRYGVIDVTPDYLARVTGLSIEDVTACMRRFCEPDPYSRSSERGGARLTLLDPEDRQWGWKVVNHAKYREKARLVAKNTREVDDGYNRERLADRRGPPLTAADPLLDKTKQNKRHSRPHEYTSETSDFHGLVIATYHALLPDLPSVKVWSAKRARALDARIRERRNDGKPADSIEYWRSLFGKVAASDFLCGRSSNWRADLPWLIKEENFAKVIEGNYDNRERDSGAHHAR